MYRRRSGHCRDLRAAESPTLARQALPDIESRLRDRGIGSAWRLLPDVHLGVVSLRTTGTLTRLVDTMGPVVTVEDPQGAVGLYLASQAVRCLPKPAE